MFGATLIFVSLLLVRYAVGRHYIKRSAGA
jgi:hypothetical protein